jgi:FtsP/CotA-like multicopper oxidase with cupredoxin domain
MALRDIYLKIERIADYSPVAPMAKTPPTITYKRDGMRNHGHDDGVIPDAEVTARTMTAVVYREYLDPAYVVPRTTKIAAADLNEPTWDRRVPGTVIYANAGDTLKIHVLNADRERHSLHVHGLEYGIDSDGSWPFGTQSSDGRRSDEICPGDSWTYTFRVTEEMEGAWPFHDHAHHSDAAVRRGLFGGIVVRKRPFRKPIPSPLPDDFDDALEKIRGLAGGRPVHASALRGLARSRLDEVYDLLREWSTRELIKPPFRDERLHVPVFLHEMATDEHKPLFDSGELEENGIGTYSRVFDEIGDFDYFCRIHPQMTGTVVVQAGAPAAAAVNILDAPAMGFYPQSVPVAPGGTITWTNLAVDHHTITSRQGSAIPTHCINGRGFVGNTPTLLARAGQPIRWYVFNLDFGTDWHNFHPHALRFTFGGETHDVRSLSPAESFMVDTTAPPVLLLPPNVQAIQKKNDRPKGAKEYRLMGDFLFHCHVHHHLENGMVGVVRSYQDVWLTPQLEQQLEDEVGLIPFDASNPIPDATHGRCKRHGEGRWEQLAVRPEKTLMHAVLLPNTSKVLYWGYTDNGTGQSRIFDPTGPTVASPANQPAGLPGVDADLSDLWSAGHTILDDANGTVLAHGGFTGPGTSLLGNIRAFLFDPASEQWSVTGSTQESRFYPTTIASADGKALALYGSLTKTIEVFDPAAGGWSAPIDLSTMPQHEFYPWTYLLPGGKLFIAGPHDPTNRFDWEPLANLETFPNLAGSRSSGGEKGTSVLLTLRPPDYAPRVIVLGGDTDNRPTKPIASAQTAELIDLSQPTPTWTQLPDLNVPRPDQVNSVLLPDGRVFVAGGVSGADGGPCEFFDPAAAAGGWQLGPTMTFVRGYHSAMILLVDGSILAGGDPNSGVFERYFPGYYFATRPVMTAAPPSVGFSATFTVDTPQAPIIAEVVLMRPGAVTHGFNMHQRAVECEVVGGTATTLDVEAPADGTIAPPGWYLLFLVDANRVPSVGRWIRLS